MISYIIVAANNYQQKLLIAKRPNKASQRRQQNVAHRFVKTLQRNAGLSSELFNDTLHKGTSRIGQGYAANSVIVLITFPASMTSPNTSRR